VTNPLAPLKYGKVVGRLLAGVIDSPDVGEVPDFPPLEGRVMFTASVPKFLVPLADPPATVAPLSDTLYMCVLDDEGFLTWRGKRGVYLAAPVAGTMNPSGWTWTVTFDLSYLGTPVRVPAFSIDVPEYIPGPDEDNPDDGSIGLVDLTVQSPVPSSAGNAVTRGVSVESVDLDVNDLVFGLDDGTFLPGVTVPSIAASAASAAAAAASATASAGSATAAANSVNSFALDALSTTTGSPGSSAAVVVSGTAPSYHLAFTIPRGDVGATGPAAPDATASVKGIIQLAGDLGGTAASPTAPTKVDKFAVTAVKTTTYTAAVADLIPADASSGGFTITLPTAPADRSRIYIKKIDATSNAVTIARGGTDVFEKASGATSLTLATQFQAVLLTYNTSAGVWHASYDLALPSLDTRFAALQLATALKTTTYTAAVGEFVPCDATSGGFTVTLPTAPADGAVITIKKIDSGSNTVTVARGGSDVFNAAGGATSMSITKQDQAQRYTYRASGAIWYVANHISNTDSRLSDARTPAIGTQYYDLSIPAFGKSTTRAAGTGDFPFGVKLQRAVTLSSVTYRGITADASGNLVVKLQKNGSDTGMTGSSATIAFGSQVTGGTATGTWSFAAGDILTVVIVSVGTTPGTGLIADITGLA
jgi:hypothetical protein